jgi:ferrochelatase
MALNIDSAATPAPPRTVLLLVNLGTPAAPTSSAIRRYLSQFLHDRRVVEISRWIWCPILHFFVLPFRAPKLAKKYAAIWTPVGSPLLAHSRALADAVQGQLPNVHVRVAMRYGEPSIASQLHAAKAQEARRVAVLPLYPQYSASTTASVHEEVNAVLAGWRARPALSMLSAYHFEDEWLDAVAQSVREHWAAKGRGARLLFSFHGLPVAQDQAGDPYAKQCRATARAVAERLGLGSHEWTLSFQSRFGKAQWLQPYTDLVLRAFAREGLKRVDVLCPGFAVDCLETLEEIAVENAAYFRAAGGEVLSYIPALNASEAHARALAAIAQRELLPLREEKA